MKSISGKRKIEEKESAMKLKKTLIGMGLVTAVVALTLLSGSPVLAASTKDVIVANTPAEPVPVTGTVEVVNDALYEPYIKTASVFDLDGGDVQFQVAFDVPDGKRLILETVVVQANVQSGQKVRVSLDSQVNPAINKYVIGFLPVRDPVPFLGTDYYVVNQPFKLRQDWFLGSTDEIIIRMSRDSSSGEASLLVTVYGYLVDSPSQGLGL
jgi:hypothetical protein